MTRTVRLFLLLAAFALLSACSDSAIRDNLYRDTDAGFAMEIAPGWNEIDRSEAFPTPMRRMMASRLENGLLLSPGKPSDTVMTLFAVPGGGDTFDLMSSRNLTRLYRKAGMDVARDEVVDVGPFHAYRLDGSFQNGLTLKIVLFVCGEKLVTLQVTTRSALDEKLADDVESMIGSLRTI